ncbi:MAG: Bug family tripartite tricarboxylate transporter substrate binding protein [Xanthobacteraceae bacterium]
MSKHLRVMTTMLAIVAIAPSASAQPYPTKPIKIVVSTSPGGITDILARVLGAHITAVTKQTVVIDNRPGGSGNIAMNEVSRAAPDGYTFGFANTGNITINPYLFKKLAYDPLNDLVPVGPVGTVQLFLVTNASRIPAKDLKEFLAYAKANPDKVSYAGAGAGTTPDLAWQDFSRRAGVKLVVVPHRGTGPATQAVLGGDVQVTFVSMGPHMQFVQKGVLRVLGSASPKRQSHMPDVPTFGEQGFPGFVAETWFALFAPKGTPQAILNQVNGYTRGLHDSADMAKRITGSFVVPLPMTQPEFAAMVKADAAKWERIVREAGIKPN